MYVKIPPPIKLRNLETDEELTAADVRDETGRTLAEQGLTYDNKPVSLLQYFMRFLAPHFQTYAEHKAADRIVRGLRRADKDKERFAEIPKDDVSVARDKLKTVFKLQGSLGMQYLEFSNAFEGASEEKPVAIEEAPRPMA